MIRNKEFVIMWRWRIWTIWSGCGERTYKVGVTLTPAHKPESQTWTRGSLPRGSWRIVDCLLGLRDGFGIWRRLFETLLLHYMGRGFIKADMFHLLLEVVIGIRALPVGWRVEGGI